MENQTTRFRLLPNIDLKLTLAAATLLASLTATTAYAFTGPARGLEPVNASGAAPMICNVIYLSDATATADYIYNDGGAFGAAAPPALPAYADGLGLYSTKRYIYAGAAPNRIYYFKPCSAIPSGFLLTANFGAPDSIAVDYSNNVYATEANSTTVDWFNSAGLDTPAAYDIPRAPSDPQYVAVDSAGNVYTSGWDPTNTFEQIDVCGPHMVGCVPCEVVPGASVPGGVALDRNQHLIVNDERGNLWVYLAGCGALDMTFAYSPIGGFTQTFTAITLDQNENRIWAAKQFNGPEPGCAPAFCVDARAVLYNSVAGTAGPMAGAGVRTPIIPNQRPGTGIALWPPGPV